MTKAVSEQAFVNTYTYVSYVYTYVCIYTYTYRHYHSLHFQSLIGYLPAKL